MPFSLSQQAQLSSLQTELLAVLLCSSHFIHPPCTENVTVLPLYVLYISWNMLYGTPQRRRNGNRENVEFQPCQPSIPAAILYPQSPFCTKGLWRNLWLAWVKLHDVRRSCAQYELLFLLSPFLLSCGVPRSKCPKLDQHMNTACS